MKRKRFSPARAADHSLDDTRSAGRVFLDVLQLVQPGNVHHLAGSGAAAMTVLESYLCDEGAIVGLVLSGSTQSAFLRLFLTFEVLRAISVVGVCGLNFRRDSTGVTEPDLSDTSE